MSRYKTNKPVSEMSDVEKSDEIYKRLKYPPPDDAIVIDEDFDAKLKKFSETDQAILKILREKLKWPHG